VEGQEGFHSHPVVALLVVTAGLELLLLRSSIDESAYFN
jgi:hypothetical protein